MRLPSNKQIDLIVVTVVAVALILIAVLIGGVTFYINSVG